MSLGPVLPLPSAANDWHSTYIKRVAAAFARVTGQPLPEIDSAAPGQSAWDGNFALLTHRGDEAATLNYGNAAALKLWECDWQTFSTTPSAKTAPQEDHVSRDTLMQAVAKTGFVAGYTGRRISSKGRLFTIQNVTVWRLLDENNAPFGVGAFFKHWK